MRPNPEELIRGIQRSLSSYVLPEMQSDHTRAEVMFSSMMLGVLLRDLDAAAQRLVEDNAALRSLARQCAETLREASTEPALADELSRLASGADEDITFSTLSNANQELAGAIARVAVLSQERPDLDGLRRNVIEALRERSQAASRSMLGPRADG